MTDQKLIIKTENGLSRGLLDLITLSGLKFDLTSLEEKRATDVMSNSQEQSLDENAEFLPMHEFSPEFLHSETERQALERLLSAGPEAFYSFIGAECSCSFLSSEEVTQITNWGEDYHLNQLQGQQEENGVEGFSEEEGLGSTYTPNHSDIPVPSLDLGWPERSPCVQMERVTVHTSPPAEGQPPVREIIRRHLQAASQVRFFITAFLTKHFQLVSAAELEI